MSVKILLSIKPEFIEKIASGEKQYEFRKVEFKQEINEILVYATAPISQVVGKIKPQEILVDTPENLWEIVEKYSGISKKFYDEYYENKHQAVAIKIKEYKSFKKYQRLSKYNVKVAPQSFVYLNN
ncbi:ASCH domain-containing protein [Lactococcus garvieae]|uniref:ASCH domain-containing protein n=1 Tax=Lactococcus garvieae TaxID=1363 RepID=UPI003D77846A